MSHAGTILYARRVGGTGFDQARGIAVDHVGRAYITGTTNSPPFGFAMGGPCVIQPGGNDAFVTRLNIDGTIGYLGGANEDFATGVAVDPLKANADVYLAGATSSGANTFPFTVGPSPVFHGGLHDAFVAQLH